MIVKKLGIVVFAGLLLVGCRHRNEPNKVLDGQPVGAYELIIPAEAARQYFLIQRDMLHVLVPVINKFAVTDPTYPELTPAGGSKYSFTTSEKHYGSATFTLEFRSDVNTTIDPVAVQGSSTAVKSVLIAGTAASSLFPTITENLTLVLDSSGVVTSTMRLSGSTAMTGSGYSLTFNLDPAGAKANFDGLTDNQTTASGTGGTPPTTAAIQLRFSTDRSANGSIAWEGRTGGIHIGSDGSGYVSTLEKRILFQ